MSTDYWKHVTGYIPADRTNFPLGVYNSMKALQGCWPTRFGNLRAALRSASGSNLVTTANIHINAYVRDNLSGIDPWLNYSRLRTLDIPQSCDYWIGWPQQEEFLIDLLRCAVRPHDNPVDAMLQSQVSYMPQSAPSLKLRAFSAIGAGVRSLSFYAWGPRYAATENWYDTDPLRLRVIGEINHAAGWVEDILLNGHPPQARIAILYSRPSELWDRLAPSEGITKPGTYLAERRILYHLLRGLQQPVDMIQDEVLPAEQGINVNDYKCIFMAQRCITRKGADMLLDWVKQGGTLIGDVSCGQFDETEQPWRIMLDAFGLKSISPQETSDPAALEIAGAGIKTRRLISTVEVKDALVVATFTNGAPAVTERKLGKGRLIYSAWTPGFAYHIGAHVTNDVLNGMQESVRPIVAGWITAAGAPACEADNPLISARLIQSPVGSAVILINSTGAEKVDKVRVTVRGMPVKSVESLEQGVTPFRAEGDSVQIELPLGLTDVLRLQ